MILASHTTIGEVKGGSSLVWKAKGFGLFLLYIGMFVAFSAPVLADEKEQAVDSSEVKWIEDPFAKAETTWVPLEGYEQKIIEEALREEEEQRAAEEAARQKEKIAKLVQKIESASIPLISNKSISPPTVDIVEVNRFTQREKKEWMTLDKAEEEMNLMSKAERLRQLFGQEPSKVNFTTLPDTSVKVSFAQKVSESRSMREKRMEVLEEAKEKESIEKRKEEAEVCEAVSAYRRRQLAAMESDRETLAALQEALKELGLSNELSFMKDSKALAKNENPSQKGSSDILQGTP